MSVLAIDQGTTSTRAMVLDRGGKARVVHAAAHRQHYPAPGWVEHDPEDLIAGIRGCIEAAQDVAAIGIDNQGESCLAWDAETKEAVSPVIVWQDSRTRDTIETLKADGAEAMVVETAGLPLESYFSASKLAWIVANLPQAKRLLDRGRLRLGTTDAFFLDRLSGTWATDITTASRTALMNLESGDWDPALCDLFGVPVEALPPIVPTTGDFGAVTCGGRRIPIVASLVDQQAALYGHGCRDAGDAKITFGTGAFALVVTGDGPHRAPGKGLLPTVAWQLAGGRPVYALDGGVFCAGSAINWARGLGLFQDFAGIDAFEGPTAIARDLAFVPALAGLACPHWDRRAAGLWIGLSLDTTPADMIRSVLEGVAFRAAEVLEAMSARVALGDEISVDGGMAANSYFCRFLADVSGRRVRVPTFGELTTLGTALLARGAVGLADRCTDMKATVYEPTADLPAERRRFAEAVGRARDWLA